MQKNLTTKTHKSLKSILEPSARMEIGKQNPNLTQNQIESLVLMRTLKESQGLESSVRAYQAEAAIRIAREALWYEYPYENLQSTRDYLSLAGIDGSKLSDLDGVSQVATWCDARELPIDDYITPAHYPPLIEAISHMRECMHEDDTVGMWELFEDVDKVVENNATHLAIRKKYRTSRTKVEGIAHAMYNEDDDVYVIVVVGVKDGETEVDLRTSIARRVEFDLVGNITNRKTNSLDISVAKP